MGPRGYSVSDMCAHPGCGKKIDRGLAYLCYGCEKYFCGAHLTFGFAANGDDPLMFDCFAGQSSQCCLKCEEECAVANDC
jgi:hypothetical protein